MRLRAETEVKLESFRTTMTDRLGRFIRNTRQPLNHDVMAFLCTGRVEVVVKNTRVTPNFYIFSII